MKKALSLLLALVLLCGVTAAAWAAPAKLEPVPADPGGKTFTLTVPASESLQSDSQYVLLILRAPEVKTEDELKTAAAFPATLDVNSILYIDQAASDSSGAVTFSGVGGSGFQLKSHTCARVYVAGAGLDQPKNIGYVYVDGVTFEGKVTFYGSTPATITLLDEAGAEQASFETEATGAFSAAVPSGTFDVRIEKLGYLPVTAKGFTTGEDTWVETDLRIFGGDFNSDGKSDYNDFNLLADDFNKVGNAIRTPAVDINADGRVNYVDINILSDGYNKGDKTLENGRPIGVVIRQQ